VCNIIETAIHAVWIFCIFLEGVNIMTKRDLVVKIARKTRQNQSDVAETVQLTLDYIAEELIAGRDIELRNFGVFEIKVRKSRKGRNPNKPKNEVVIPERTVVKFRAGKELKDAVEKLNPADFK
jgi:nucleoid DNA-binding protein